MYRTIAITLITVYLSACNTANIRSGDTALGPNQGIVLTKLHTNVNRGNVLIHHKDATWPSATFEPVKAPADLRVLKMREGEARFSRIYKGNLETWRHTGEYFNIQAGKINYIGDFVMEWTAGEGGIGVISRHIDREEETIKEAKEKYPELFAKYQYIKNIPVAKIDEVEGYKPIKEIEEIKNKQH